MSHRMRAKDSVCTLKTSSWKYSTRNLLNEFKMFSAFWIYRRGKSIQVHKRKRYFFPNKYPWRLLLILHNTSWCHRHGNVTEQAYATPDYHVTIEDGHKVIRTMFAMLSKLKWARLIKLLYTFTLSPPRLFLKTVLYLLTKQNHIIPLTYTIGCLKQ